MSRSHNGLMMNDWTVDKGNAFHSSDEYQCVQIYALKTINKQ